MPIINITKAPKTPGTHPQSVKNVTNKIAPQPLSKTANGGKRKQKINLRNLFTYFFTFQIRNI